MALTDKQRLILQAGLNLNKRVGATKSFIDIIEEKVTGATLTGLVSEVKAQVVAMKTARKDAIISDINSING